MVQYSKLIIKFHSHAIWCKNVAHFHMHQVDGETVFGLFISCPMNSTVNRIVVIQIPQLVKYCNCQKLWYLKSWEVTSDH